MNIAPIRFFERQQLDARPQQVAVLEKVQAEWDNYKYFLLSCPTGTGKTYIATAIASVLTNAYILTSTLQLQEQYESSWDAIVNLKGRGNYTCALNPEFTVDAAPCCAARDLAKVCLKDNICDYYNQKRKALQSQSMITNPVYFLYSTHCGFGEDVGENPWIQRSALIIDEAHNLEKHLCSFAESKIDPKSLQEDHGVRGAAKIKFNDDVAHNYEALQQLKEMCDLRAAELAEQLETEFPRPKPGFEKAWAKGIEAKVAEKAKKLNSRIYALDKTIQPLNIFFNTHDTFEELEDRWLMMPNFDDNTLQLSPLKGGFLFHEYMGKMADKFVLMSATLGDKAALCRELGIDEKEALWIESDTPFEPEKSPILAMPRLKMGYKDLQQTFAPMAKLVEQIVMDIHPNERGIIHAATYKIQNELVARVSKPLQRRFMHRDMEALGPNPPRYPRKIPNAELLKRHGEIKDSVLVSPSMMEGVDLYDDLSVFQLILKMPWASLGDPRVKKKSELDPDWYTNAVWLHLMQASGRSTRSTEDQSVTYVLDSSYPYFFDKWKRRLPKWFTERHVFEDGVTKIK